MPKLYHRYVCIGKNIVHIGLVLSGSGIYQASWNVFPVDKGTVILFLKLYLRFCYVLSNVSNN
jgi:glyoxylate utilization-related uncharacterized protein